MSNQSGIVRELSAHPRRAALPTQIEDGGPEAGPWQAMLYARLRGRPYPLFVFEEVIVPAASIWSGARLWLHAFREAGLVAGDRIVVAVKPSPAFVQVLVACLWEGYTVAFAPETDQAHTIDALMTALDARCAVAPVPFAAHVLTPQICEGPTEGPLTLRPSRYPATPEVRFLLRTSGSRSLNGGHWVGLSDRNLLSVLDSHLPRLGLVEQHSHVLSILPWHHAFGLILDLLPALFSGAEILRDAADGRDPDTLIRLGSEFRVTHLSAVPMTLMRLRERPEGDAFLRSLEGGIVGGAPVSRSLAEFLSETRLRAGYGQTEASPGITLGEPGYWPGPNYLGRPIGCAVKTDRDGVLAFCGENACHGLWDPERGLQAVFGTPGEIGTWRTTGDIVRQMAVTGDLFFVGRSDDTFKLANGRRVAAGQMEMRLTLICEGVSDAVLFSPEGETLVLLRTGAASEPGPSEDCLDSVLEGLRPRLTENRYVAPENWPRTRKGTTDRQELIRRFSQHTE
ncbi:MAG: class I adenylate-forming enzyme family protein [Capsulimonadales bacterium]|nr:class I adenylate-forming enzyme family protein [Capsulimonadales bacterium]